MRRDKTYEPDPAHAWVIRLIFHRYRQGASQFTIAQELAMRGIPTPRGKPTWKAGKIGRLLDNPAYAALMPIDGVLIPGNWDALIDPEVWRQVSERRR
jgi:site-specific DNA recombinase